MKEKKRNLTTIPLIIYWITLFSVTAVLLFFILPEKPKFRYEYQKGFQWPHKNLVAPFDFPVLKSASDIKAETDEIIKSIIPYYQFDTVTRYRNIAKLSSDLHNIPSDLKVEKERIITNLKNQLSEIYNVGILQKSADSYLELQDKNEIKKRTGTVVTAIATEKIFSEKTAYNLLNETIEEQIRANPGMRSWLGSINAEKYISANLEFDKATTDKEIAERTSQISPTRGMVQSGERIIIEGEIVDNAKFQILESLKTGYNQKSNSGTNNYMMAIGKIMFILAMLGLVFAFIYIYRYDILTQHRKLAFLLLFMTLMIFISYFINGLSNINIYLVPLAIFPIIIRTFFDSRTAIFMLLITALIIGFNAPNNYEYILLQFSAGVVAVFSLNKMHRRVHLVKAVLLVMFTYWFVYTALNLILEGTMPGFNLNIMKWFAMNSLFILVVYPLIYVFEKIFGFISDVTLIEISDSNQPLLRKLAEEAPGTFQHSMQIANLAEDVILKIGGNPFLVRAGALYHDIGKIAKPHFFIENQAAGLNPHNELSYIKSAEVIIDHVRNGVKMAYKHKLPESIIEFIATHHGTTKANYFFIKHKQENPDNLTDENSFDYPGPLPRSKEATVVMLIDGIEAASRTLKDKNVDNLNILINNMINDKIKLGQLDNSTVTFNDINIIKETLLHKLINIYHVRIEYPKDDLN